jgi:Ca2+-binding RTX toxin-like protein
VICGRGGNDTIYARDRVRDRVDGGRGETATGWIAEIAFRALSGASHPIHGAAGRNVICGKGGNDTIYGRGHDLVLGGAADARDLLRSVERRF